MGGRIIAQRLAQTRHGLGECRFADDRIAPDRVHQLPPRHKPLTVGDQVDEEPQYQGLEMDLLTIAGESPRLRVDQKIIKAVHRLVFLCLQFYGPGN